jgi:hypothetical protein
MRPRSEFGDDLAMPNGTRAWVVGSAPLDRPTKEQAWPSTQRSRAAWFQGNQAEIRRVMDRLLAAAEDLQRRWATVSRLKSTDARREQWQRERDQVDRELRGLGDRVTESSRLLKQFARDMPHL